MCLQLVILDFFGFIFLFTNGNNVKYMLRGKYVQDVSLGYNNTFIYINYSSSGCPLQCTVFISYFNILFFKDITEYN